MNIEDLRRIADTFGYDAQSRQAIEEMAELTQAINKFWRKEMLCSSYLPKEDVHKEYREHIAEEIADVYIMLQQLEYLLGIEEKVEKYKQFKVERTIKRMEGYRNEEDVDTNNAVNRG